MPQKIDDIQLMLNLIGEGLRGKRNTTLSADETERLICVSRQYGVDALCYFLTKNTKQTTIDHKHYRDIMIVNCITQQNVGDFLERMEKAGIHAVVLKGYSLAQLYPEPLCRTSSDTDLLISKEAEQKVFEYLKKQGFALKGKRPRFGCDSQWYREDVGTIELHISLFNPLNTRALFSPAIDQINTQGEYKHTPVGEICMLDPVSNLLHVFMHLAKHYYIGNMTLQMVLDFWLLYQVCADSFDYIHKCAKEIDQHELLESLIAFGKEYFDHDTDNQNSSKTHKSDKIYGALFRQENKNIYRRYVFERIMSADQLEWGTVLLYFIWRINIIRNAIKSHITKRNDSANK